MDDLFGDLQICPTLNDVDFFKDGTISLPGLDGQDKNQDATDGVDTNMEEEGQANAPEDDQLDYGYDAFDFGDDDGGGDDELMDPFADPIDGEDGIGGVDADNEHNTGEAVETDLVTNISSNQESELLRYFDTTLSKNWAGPTHWKLRKTKSSKFVIYMTRGGVRGWGRMIVLILICLMMVASTQRDKNHEHNDDATTTAERSQKKTPARHFTIDFLEGEDIIVDEIFATQRRGNITLSHTKDHLTYLLPDDENFSSKQLLRYFMKPVFSVCGELIS